MKPIVAISRKTEEYSEFENGEQLAIFMLGRPLSNYDIFVRVDNLAEQCNHDVKKLAKIIDQSRSQITPTERYVYPTIQEWAKLNMGPIEYGCQRIDEFHSVDQMKQEQMTGWLVETAEGKYWVWA